MSSSATLRFIESTDHFSIYVDVDENEVYLAHGTARRLEDFNVDDVDAYFEDFKKASGVRLNFFTQAARGMFADWLLGRYADHSLEIEDISWCETCAEPVHEDEVRHFYDGEIVCEGCTDRFWYCEDCENLFRGTTTTLQDTEVCDSCRSQNWTHCDHCQGYDRDSNMDMHDHEPEDESAGCCESPAQRFSIRNEDGVLVNDATATIALPAGHISDEGIGAIANAIRQHANEVYRNAQNIDDDEQERVKQLDIHNRLQTLSYSLDQIGQDWQAKGGNYTKRLGKLAHKEFEGLKIPPTLISEIGNIARAHSMGVEVEIAITRDLNMSAYEFGHEESCWWQSYSASRCSLKSNGGFGIRSFGPYGEVSGRAWVMPLKLSGTAPATRVNNCDCCEPAAVPQVELQRGLTPTFDAINADAFMVFNGYGDLENYAPARILAQMVGMTYRKVEFSCSPMYVNNGSGYLVAPEDIADPYTDSQLIVNTPHHSDLFSIEQQALAVKVANENEVLVNA